MNIIDELQSCISHCHKYKTMLRYFDLNEIVNFIYYINKNNIIQDDRYKIAIKYEDLSNMTMNNIKIHYLEILERINLKIYGLIYIIILSLIEKLNMSLIFILLQKMHIH